MIEKTLKRSLEVFVCGDAIEEFDELLVARAQQFLRPPLNPRLNLRMHKKERKRKRRRRRKDKKRRRRECEFERGGEASDEGKERKRDEREKEEKGRSDFLRYEI